MASHQRQQMNLSLALLSRVADGRLNYSSSSSSFTSPFSSSTGSTMFDVDDEADGDLDAAHSQLLPLLAGGNNNIDSDAAYSLALLLKLRLAAEDSMDDQLTADSSAPYLLVLASIIFLLSLVANVLVVISVFRSRRYRATAGLLALNLTVADLLITVVLLPLWMVQQNLSTSNSYLFSIIVCKIHPALLTMSVGASAYTLVALSVDRMCIVRLSAVRTPASSSSPFMFSSHQDALTRRRRSSIASWLCSCRSQAGKIATVAAPWLLSIVVAAPVLYFRTAQDPPKIEELIQMANLSSIQKIINEIHKGVTPEASCREEWPAPLLLIYDQALLIIHFALPALIQLCLYIYLGWIVSRLTAIPATRSGHSSDTTTLITTQGPSQQGGAVRGPNSPPGMSTAVQMVNNSHNAIGATLSVPLASNGSRQQLQQQQQQPYGSVSIVRRQRAWRTLIALSVLFPISWLPYYILYTYLVNADPAAIGPRTNSLHTLLELFAMLGFSNSAQNAIVYCATDDRLRGSVKSFLTMIPCLYRWQGRLGSLTGAGQDGGIGNGHAHVVFQMNPLTSHQQRYGFGGVTSLKNAQQQQQQHQNQQQQQQRRQQHAAQQQLQQQTRRPANNNNNNNNTNGSLRMASSANRMPAGQGAPSPKLLAPPLPVHTLVGEDRIVCNGLAAQRARGGTYNGNNKNRQQRKPIAIATPTPNYNNNNNNNNNGSKKTDAEQRTPEQHRRPPQLTPADFT